MNKWPLGTRQRLAYALLIYTGQRVGDVSKMNRADIVDGELHVIQQKTRAELYLPIAPELEQAMKACTANGLSLIASDTGQPMTRAGLSHFMREAIKDAGLPAKCVSHDAEAGGRRENREADRRGVRSQDLARD